MGSDNSDVTWMVPMTPVLPIPALWEGFYMDWQPGDVGEEQTGGKNLVVQQLSGDIELCMGSPSFLDWIQRVHQHLTDVCAESGNPRKAGIGRSL